jgi:hypothetical protein
MAIEVAVAFIAAIRAHSVALAAFGGDSAIELLSAAVVLARFHSSRRITEKMASKFTGSFGVTCNLYRCGLALHLDWRGIEAQPKLSPELP